MPKRYNTIFMVEINLEEDLVKELGGAAKLLTMSDDRFKNLDFKYC
ncbi:hypothetical protein HN924_02985 [Candidatus Woesearchaeota archaeon]|jgi:hypothetical protein|nr:hypothetical protein [Candidatus Woesearchaeota archaeon]MBT7062907.1 hypothetical protein [Candidatus Woesearchaeota archaeon]MBT7402241.1 hypothetical protein [Candidatus Woesearchaeota archaeon]